jgi:hypothetical protein
MSGRFFLTLTRSAYSSDGCPGPADVVLNPTKTTPSIKLAKVCRRGA